MPTTRLLFCVLLLFLPATMSTAQQAGDLTGPIKIVGLLWDASPQGAADSFRTTVLRAAERGKLKSLTQAVEVLREKGQRLLASSAADDPRFAAALVIALLTEEGETGGSQESRQAALQRVLTGPSSQDRQMVLAVWFDLQPKAAFAHLRESLPKTDDGAQAAILIDQAFRVDRGLATEALLAVWPRLPAQVRLVAIEPLTASQDSMAALVSAVAAGKVSKDIVNTNQLRKWLQTDNEQLKSAIEQTWGRVRMGEDAQRQELVQKTLQLLESGVQGSVSRGQTVFTRVCSQCHRLHGQGVEVGPEITGNGRGNLSQLVSNVLDPSLVIGEAFQAKTILTYDGQVLSGLVVEETDQYLKLKLQGGKIVELDQEEDIELLKPSTKSLMPEGVEEQMTQQEMLDLFAYLCLLKAPGTDDNELIPGTPVDFVIP